MEVMADDSGEVMDASRGDKDIIYLICNWEGLPNDRHFISLLHFRNHVAVVILAVLLALAFVCACFRVH